MKTRHPKQGPTCWSAALLLGLAAWFPLVASADISNGCIYSTDSRGHNPQAITAYNFGPQLYYYSGDHSRTYFLWMQKGGGGYSIENMVFYYDHDTEEISESYGVGLGTYGATDPHGHGALVVADDGHIIVVHEQLRHTGASAHNGPYQVKRSIEPENPAAGFSLVHTTASGNCYPHIWKLANGDLFVSSRYGSDAYSDHYRIKFYKSEDDGLTWDAGKIVVNFGTAENYWAYHARIMHADSDGIHLVVNRCNRDPSYGYPDCYYLQSADGETWTNVDNSFTKNITTQGAIDVIEMDTYCLIEHSPDASDILGISTGCFSPAGNLYLVQQDTNRQSTYNPVYWYLRYWEDGEWQKIDITEVFPAYNIRLMGNCIYGIHSCSDTEFDVYLLRTDDPAGGIHEIQKWQTTDRGETWTMIEDITSSSSYDNRYLAMTSNVPDSPYIGLAASYLNDPSHADIFIWARPTGASAVDEPVLQGGRDNVVLWQNSPNPFSARIGSGQTTISYSLAASKHVSLRIHDANGHLLETLVDGVQDAGDHSVVWSGREDRTSGIYLYRIEVGNLAITRKCVLLK
ncbi:MAG: BNR-4 repeat-containing protein [Candidatus Eisenbacteria sp.]|nr:BNR-4 repeat-containing protein [Candidatus Eisenbacteria bacterium]